MLSRLMLLAAATALLAGSAAAQVDTLWVRTFDGTAHNYDYAGSVAVDAAGNVFAAGYATMSGTGADFITIKYLPNGDTAWVRTYNGPGNGDDGVRDIAVDAAGNSYVTGWSYGASTGRDFATVAYDPLGNTRWAVRLGAPGDTSDVPDRVKLDGSGSVYVTGSSYDSVSGFNYLTVKYDSTGETLWTRRYDGGYKGGDYPYDMAVDSVGNVFLAGSARDSTGQSVGAVLKYSPDGSLLWARHLPLAMFYAVAVGGPGRVYAGGYLVSPPGAEDFAVVAYDAGSGDTAWTFTYDGGARDQDEVHALAVGLDGAVYAAGNSTRDTVNWNYDYLTVKLQPNGDTAWIRRHLGPYPGSDDYAIGIAVDAAGRAFVTGRSVDTTNTNVFATVGYNSDGTEEWYVVYRPNSNGGEGCAIATCDMTSVCVTGYYYFTGPGSDIVTIRYGLPPAVAELPGPAAAGRRMDQSVVRNVLFLSRSLDPSIPRSLLDISGRKVLDLKPGANDVQALAPGVYFVRGASGAGHEASGITRVVVTH